MTERQHNLNSKLVIYPDSILLEPCQDVIATDDEIELFIRSVEEILRSLKGRGLGLAAPQLGRSYNIFTLDESDYKKKKEKYIHFINPKIIEKSNICDLGIEGCLSIPGVLVAVARSDYVKIQAEDIDGNVFEYEADGLKARTILHELDHLQGKLILDYAKGIQRQLIEPALAKLRSEVFHRLKVKHKRKKRKGK